MGKHPNEYIVYNVHMDNDYDYDYDDEHFWILIVKHKLDCR